jgi:acyl carrier protein
MADAIQEKVISAVRSTAMHLQYADIPMETSIEELAKDSLDQVSLLFDLEAALGFEVPVDALKDVRTLADLILKVREMSARTCVEGKQ